MGQPWPHSPAPCPPAAAAAPAMRAAGYGGLRTHCPRHPHGRNLWAWRGTCLGITQSSLSLFCWIRTAGSQLPSHDCHPLALQEARPPPIGEERTDGFVPHQKAALKPPLRFLHLQSVCGLTPATKTLMDGHRGHK